MNKTLQQKAETKDLNLLKKVATKTNLAEALWAAEEEISELKERVTKIEMPNLSKTVEVKDDELAETNKNYHESQKRAEKRIRILNERVKYLISQVNNNDNLIETMSNVNVAFDNEWGAALIDASEDRGIGPEEYIREVVKTAIIADGYDAKDYAGYPKFADYSKV